MSKIITNNKGFSLIELMVVVAIIGVLSAVGVPQYQKFQAKARQSEAKSHLNALYVSEASFKSEWNLYTIDLKNIGFSVVGNNLRYTAGFNATGCTSYSTTNGAPTELTTTSQAHLSSVTPPGDANWNTAIGFSLTTAVTLNGQACSDTAFIGVAAGDPRSSPGAFNATNSDRWSINEQKKVSQLINGI